MEVVLICFMSYTLNGPIWFLGMPVLCCLYTLCILSYIKTLKPRQDGRHFADDIFTCVYLNEDIWISINISLRFVPKGPIDNIPALVQIMAWRRPGNKPLSDPMMTSLLVHICVTRPQWVKTLGFLLNIIYSCSTCSIDLLHNSFPCHGCGISDNFALSFGYVIYSDWIGVFFGHSMLFMPLKIAYSNVCCLSKFFILMVDCIGVSLIRCICCIYGMAFVRI